MATTTDAAPASTDAAPVTKRLHVFGIDFGSQRCVVADSNGDIVLNELGGMTTATLVSFKGDERNIGEAAVLSSSTNPLNTIDYLNVLLGKDLEELKQTIQLFPGQRAVWMENDQQQVVVQVDYCGSKRFFTIEQLTAMLFGQLIVNTKKRLVAESEQLYLVIAVPTGWQEKEKKALAKALKIANVDLFHMISRDQALARCFHQKHPIVSESESESESESDSQKRFLALVDMGHTSTSVTIVEFTSKGENILSCSCDLNLGSETFDRRLFTHFQQEVDTKFNVQVDFHSKEGKRLLNSCEKLKKLLSTIPEAKVSVENIVPDRDISLALTRPQFQTLIEKDLQQVQTLIQQAVKQVQVDIPLVSIEIVGGGTRMPLVQEAIVQGFELTEQSLGRMLDSTTSIAVGAACFEPMDTQQKELTEEEDFTEFIELEQQMQQRDAEIAQIAHERNAIEAFVYEMRGKKHQPHGELLDFSVLDPLLTEAEEWIYSEESEQASLIQLQSKRKQIQDEIQTTCQVYFNQVKKEQEALEQDLEQQAAAALQQQQQDNQEDNQEDHDFRKLKKPERMRLMMKNKEEGTELFKDGNYQHAAMRYVKSLGHASKFFDLTPQDEEEVKKIKLSLYLNLAQCYLKLENYQKVIFNCQEALVLDPLSTKAFYRRALAYEKTKDIEKALQDVQKALEITPQDKAIKKVEERLHFLTKKQLEKEKKMWSKAFA